MDSLNQHPNQKATDLRVTAMTLSGEEESLITEATQILLEFAVTKGHTLHSVTHMTRTQLADFLRDFYGKVKGKGDDTSHLNLKDLRVGLHKFFLDEVSIDIIRDRNFELANATFDLALRANPRKCNRMRIEMDDLKKIYLSEAMDTNKPDSLQNKVFFDISLYICNKGKEYFRNMKKIDFDVSTDMHGRRYVWLKDTTHSAQDDEQATMKRTDDDNCAFQVGERMYERPGDPRCPLSSFLKYVTHLHPMTDAFWQRPKRSVSQSDYVWYDHAPLGSSTLTKIMQRISFQAGLSDNYTNYSIRSACIPLVEAVCEEALRTENVRMLSSQQAPVPAVDIVKPSGTLSHSNSEDISSDDGMSQTSDMQAAKDLDSNSSCSGREKPPGIARSVGSGSMDTDDGDVYGLMQAKTQVLDLIRGLMVKDIQKFVDWLKTVRVQYSAGELIVLCSPVDKSNVEPVSDDITVERNQIPSRNGTPDPVFKKSNSMDITEKRQKLRKESSVKEESERQDVPEMTGMTIKQVEFSCTAGVYCSTDESCPMKVTVPTQDTLLVTGVPENMQLMLHKKRGQNRISESLTSRVFCSENELDVAEVVAVLGSANKKAKQRNGYNTNNHIVSSSTNGVGSPYHQVLEHQQHQSKPQQMTVVHHSQHQPVMVSVPAAHTRVVSPLTAREQFKEQRIKSMGCLDAPPAIHERVALKRVCSTGTPVLKRQAHVVEACSAYPENLTVKRAREDNIQATNLSMKPLRKAESQEEKKARSDRLDDSLRYHQEILQNSPLIKRPGERNFSGFRHCYANTVNNSVKPEPLDTSYS